MPSNAGNTPPMPATGIVPGTHTSLWSPRKTGTTYTGGCRPCLTAISTERHEFCGVHRDGRTIYLEDFTTHLLFQGRPAIIDRLDRGWLVSRILKEFLKKHYR